MKTDQIFKLTCPYSNPYQGNASRILFVCSVGMLRSPTAAAVAIKQGYNARSCGSCQDLALIPLSVNLIMWADKIVFMNEENEFEALQTFFGDIETTKKLNDSVVWDIEDNFDYYNPILQRICAEKLEELFK